MPEITDPSLLAELNGGGSPAGMGGFVPLGPRVPKQPTPQTQEARASTIVNTARTRQQMAADSAVQPFKVREARARAITAEREANSPRQMTPQVAEARAKLGQALRARKQLQTAWQLWKESQGTPDGQPKRSLKEYLPNERNKQFDAAVAPLQTMVRGLFKIPGDPMSNQEGAPINATLPDRWDFDQANMQRFNDLDGFLKDVIRENAAVAGVKINETKPQQKKGQRGPVRISSDEEFDRLPRGAVFIAPDGSRRRKP